MRSALVVGSAAFALLFAASPTSAKSQTVIISNRPVAVAVPVRRQVERRDWPRVIVVARIDLGGNRGRGRGHGHAYGRMDERGWRARGYRPVAVYYVDGRYYDRWDDHFRGRNVRREMVYERDGRYYRDWDDDRYDSRYDRYDTRNDRYDGRDDRYDRRDGRYDDRNRNDDRHDRDDRDDRGGYDR
ncbi:MAG: hypothetical protein ACM3OH_09390 [Bacillota bacterium]|jgi:hypothetical protein